jgi:poly-gamma-glutamate capsule biosynthesis protein CapA/YwtB (metallophosphatase superfamily)
MRCLLRSGATLPVVIACFANAVFNPVRGGESLRRDDHLAARSSSIVRLVLVGDIMLDRRPGEVVAKGEDPFAEFAPILVGADLAVGNLECVISTTGERVAKPFNFRAHPRVVPLLARYFDGLSLANNHTGDFGKAAFVEQLDRLDQGPIAHFGGGRNLKEAHTPLIFERNGIRIALLGYDEFKPRSFEAGADTPGVAWSLDQEAQVVADIKAARAVHSADVVIPFMHWGSEDDTDPNDRQQTMAHIMIDAGADAVVGAHPHITQSAEYYKGRLIVYSLGNFVFDGYEGRTGWVLRLTLSKNGLLEWDTVVGRTDERGIPHRDSGALSPRERVGSEAITMGRSD